MPMDTLFSRQGVIFSFLGLDFSNIRTEVINHILPLIYRHPLFI